MFNQKKLITSAIKDGNSKYYLTAKDKIISLVASIFSIIFSLSIVFELRNIVDGYVLTFLTVFVILFLIWNERAKVIELRKLYSKSKKVSYILIAFTFIISLSLSSIGIYFWTNKSFEKEKEVRINKAEKTEHIYNKHKAYNDSINNLSIVSNPEYQRLNESLDFWRNRRPANLEERTYIRERIEAIEENINNLNKDFETKKEKLISANNQKLEKKLTSLQASIENDKQTISRLNYITYIFLILIVITEFVIINFAKEIGLKQKELLNLSNSKQGKTYIKELKLLKSIYSLYDKGNSFVENDLKTIQFVNKVDYNDFKIIINLFKQLNIVSIDRVKNTNPKSDKPFRFIWTVRKSEKEALTTFDNYYNRLLDI